MKFFKHPKYWDVKRFTVNPNETIVIRFDMDSLGFDVYKVVSDKLKDAFPNNNIIGIPKNIDIELWDKS